jgi:hypothetical protein
VVANASNFVYKSVVDAKRALTIAVRARQRRKLSRARVSLAYYLFSLGSECLVVFCP